MFHHFPIEPLPSDEDRIGVTLRHFKEQRLENPMRLVDRRKMFTRVDERLFFLYLYNRPGTSPILIELKS